MTEGYRVQLDVLAEHLMEKRREHLEEVEQCAGQLALFELKRPE